MIQQNPIPQPLIIANVTIRQDGDGRYCMNDLHKASGAALKHKPANWFVLDSTRSLAHELAAPESPEGKPNYPTGAVKIGEGRPSIHICRALVYVYALWISHAFFAKVAHALSPAGSGAELANGSVLTIEESAKTLQMEPRALCRYLEGLGWICRRMDEGGAPWMACPEWETKGYLTHKHRTALLADGSTKPVRRLRVTPLGLSVLSALLRNAEQPSEAGEK